MEFDQAIKFTFPIYSYLMEPGPRPGALRDSQSGLFYVPLWTNRRLFDEFVENFEFSGPICGLQINDRCELGNFLGRFDHPSIMHVAIDPSAQAWDPCELHNIEEILRQCYPAKPR